MPGFGQFGNWLGQTATGLGQGLGLVANRMQPSFAINPQAYAMNPQAGNINYGQADQSRDAQMGLLAQLQRQASGQELGPSVAQGQLQQATDANLQNTMALGAAQQGQGLGYGAGLRGIADQQARIQQQSAGQSALLRAQEMAQARGELSGLASGMRGQDIGAAQAQAGNELHRAGMTAQLGLQGQQMQAGQGQAYDQMNQQAEQQAINRRLGMISGMGSAIGTIAGGPLGGMIGNGIGGLFRGGQSGGGGEGMGIVPDMPMGAGGGYVPGYATGGNSYANDTVHALLSPGEIVLPRSVTQVEDSPEKAKAFVAALQRRKATRRKAA